MDDKVPPVGEGEILTGQTVINKGKHNDGVVKYDGYIIFVSGNDIELGDVITLTMDKVLPKFGIATKLEGEQEWTQTLYY